MTFRQLFLLTLVGLVLVGCRREAPADSPDPDPAAAEDARARADAETTEAERLRRAEEARAREAEAARIRDILSERIHFEYDSEQLSREAQERLQQKAAIMRANPNVRIRIEGHTDERGTTEYNLALGQRRAESARAFLGRYGISPNRISTLSYGKERPMADGSNERAWAMNRRAEFRIIEGELTTVPPELR